MHGGLAGEVTLDLRPEFETHASKVQRLDAENNKNKEDNKELNERNSTLDAEVERLGAEINKMSEENDRFAANNKILGDDHTPTFIFLRILMMILLTYYPVRGSTGSC